MRTQRTVVSSDHIDAEDMRLNADQLDEKYNPTGGGQHPVLTKAHWRNDVAHQVTTAGYWEWVSQTAKDVSIEPVILEIIH
ncbi:hypothetical protein [Methylibium petroleiphilum]|uniref:Uncharacterized protein n=1 Tax=Methylibium petroleiphilum (strain ATCC BAA-1232 / LMG 22953 / PM1) TaxID=420662 RepID=A2SN96_METPP|nr:hypothetical protein [Methylibium petroleiphilum]ABM97035.1 hypothetical protein Mpe_B0260 [Methylibium petroleiphilum PM1]